MALEFTQIPDREGTALYILHHGSILERHKLDNLKQDIEKMCDHQIFLVELSSPDGEKIRDFYDILPSQLPALLAVRDDDSIAHSWYGSSIPAADVIAFSLRQESEK